MQGLRRDRRALILSGVIALHVAILLWLMTSRIVVEWTEEPVLTTRSLTLPPPVIPMPDPVPVEADSREDAAIGPPRASTEPAPAPREALPTPQQLPAPRPQMIDVAPAPIPLPALARPQSLPGTGGSAAGASGTGGPGTGGSGTGRGGGGTGGSGQGVTIDGQYYAAARWLRRPRPQDWNTHWPRDAQRGRISGNALLACQVRESGRPDRCWTLTENPRGQGVGNAAVRLSRSFRIRPVLEDGRPVDAPVIVPVNFVIRSLDRDAQRALEAEVAAQEAEVDRVMAEQDVPQ